MLLSLLILSGIMKRFTICLLAFALLAGSSCKAQEDPARRAELIEQEKALHEAASQGHTEVAKLLIKK